MLLLGDIQLAKATFLRIDQYIKIPLSTRVSQASQGWKDRNSRTTSRYLPETATKRRTDRPGQIAKAIRGYQDLVSKYPTSVHANDAKARLDV